jgi:hypothetical protein
MVGEREVLAGFWCWNLRETDNLENFRNRRDGLVVRVSGYRYRGPGFDSRRYQIF